MQIKISNLLRYRNIWLGFAMVWILFVHSGFEFSFMPLIYFQMWGYAGVDICLFASGIGCYYSLSKDPDILNFMKRRVRRLAPAYLCFIIPWLIFQSFTSPFPFPIILGNLLGIQHLTGLWGSFNWYISALILYYLLAPYFKALVDRTEKALVHAVIVVGLMVISIPFWTVNPYIIIMSRLGILYLGMLLAKHSQRGDSIGRNGLIAILFAMTAGFAGLDFCYRYLTDYLWSHGLYWYPCTFTTPGLCILISLAASALEKRSFTRWVTKGLSFLGTYSFEIYLLHLPLYEALPALLESRSLPVSKNLIWLGTFPVVLLGSFLLKTVSSSITRRLGKYRAT